MRNPDRTLSERRCVRVEKKLGARLACFLRAAEEDEEAEGASAAEEATGEEGAEVEVVGAVEIGIAGREERGAGLARGRARRDGDVGEALEELEALLLDWKVTPVAVLGIEGTLNESSSVFTDVLLRCKNDRPFAIRLDLLACTEFS